MYLFRGLYAYRRINFHTQLCIGLSATELFFLWFLRFILLIWKAKLQEGRRRQRPSVHWFIPQMTVVVRSCFWSPTWVQVLRPSYAVLPGTIAGSWTGASRAWTGVHMGCQHHRWHQSVMPQCWPLVIHLSKHFSFLQRKQLPFSLTTVCASVQQITYLLSCKGFL